MSNGTKAFVVAGFMALVAISGSQGKAANIQFDDAPKHGIVR
ncbi:hypothetical protein SAMN04488515_1793 [Cognatiyoonia koreensis]|uniref:Uncharacterized protein n=1 Tax=Cognatiyoonia koreensis TaxID=364200 RepID=A0A1I0QB30_9RHOB|nr:hypothetical protein [Cognatiyoonia koreensis]SEW24236.1 hypothetical protein SAMN04488515_1793 [Cognatiyoonia koreensis]